MRDALAVTQGFNPAGPPAAPLAIAPIVTAIVCQMRPAARARGVRILHSGADDVRATIDPTVFERVVVNLLENAVRATPGGRVAVWSGYPRNTFLADLRAAGFAPSIVPLHEGGRVRARAYVGARPS